VRLIRLRIYGKNIVDELIDCGAFLLAILKLLLIVIIMKALSLLSLENFNVIGLNLQ
jgi:hypothetical protein